MATQPNGRERFSSAYGIRFLGGSGHTTQFCPALQFGGFTIRILALSSNGRFDCGEGVSADRDQGKKREPGDV
jgi:hypothetical protein